MPNLGVAICTYNRVDSLARTLESFTRARPVPSSEWELLVIDNNSTDTTRSVAEAFAARLPLSYHFESRQGLSSARNRAIAEYRGRLLVFTDDDILIGEDWLQAYLGAVDQYPEAGYFSGPIAPFFPEGRPHWLRDEAMPLVSGLIGYFNLGSTARPYRVGDMHPFGANFALRRALIEKVGAFNPVLGAKGSVPGRAEEAEYFKRVASARFAGHYLPDASCQHCVQLSHLKLGYLYRYGVQKGIAEAYMQGSGGRVSGGRVREVWQLVRGMGQLMKGRPDRWRQSVISAGIIRGLGLGGETR